jgi:YVTN family beta-propeller protein
VGVRTLGRFRVLRDGQELSLGGRQQRAVLAVLAVHSGAAVSVGRIADGLWGEQVPAGHQQTIQTYVSHLRHALGPDRGLLSTTSNGYCLQVAAEDVDSERFTRLVHEGLDALRSDEYERACDVLGDALDLWDGDVLADLQDYPFVDVFAHHLNELHLTAREARTDALLHLGEHADVAAELEPLLAAHPLRERFHAQHMLALYRGGRQADALAAFQRLRRLLDDELGVEPGPEVCDLHQAILRHDPQLQLPTYAVNTASPNGAAPALDGGRTQRRRKSRPYLLVAAAAAVIVALGSVTAYKVTHTHSTLSAIPSNSVAAVRSDGTLRDAISIGSNPSALAYGAGSLWAVSTTQGRVYRIDPKQHRIIQTIQVGHAPVAIAVTDRDAWVVNSMDGSVSRINTQTDTVADTVFVGALPSAIAAGSAGVWVVNAGDGTIQHIDPANDSVGAPIDVGGAPTAVALAPDTLFVADDQQRTVTRLDPRTGQQLGAPLSTGSGPSALAVTPGALWVVDSGDQSLDRIDPSSGDTVKQFPVGDGADGIAVHDGMVWVSTRYDGTVTEIDAKTDAIVQRRSVGGAPTGVAAAAGSVWVAAGASDATAHAGGTLRVLNLVIPGHISLDPSSMYIQSSTLWTFHLVYDGLVSIQYAEGANGLSLVPDLATSLPQPTDGGKTYAFTVRPGIQFSTGVQLQASDIERGVFRDLTIDPGWAATSHILGADACVAHKAKCNIDKGVVVDDTARSIVFHLSEPDPDFLTKLAYFGMAVAPGAPATEAKVPLPGTGPYEISSYSKAGVFALTRNPRFKQWSAAAQPAGYPDRIEFAKYGSTEQRLQAVADGKADLVTLNEADDAAPMAQFAKNYPGRFEPTTQSAVEFWRFNTTEPPFNDVRVRQAVNYAIDRNRIVAILGGTEFATPTCQMLPPSFPGWRRYCPYSAGDSAAPYAGPDLDKARQLIAQAGAAGKVVTLTGMQGANKNEAITAYLASALRDIGLTVRISKPYGNFSQILSARPHWQLLSAPGWIADYPAASDFYFSLVSCHQSYGLVSNQLYCNRALDNEAQQALDLESTDPAGARTQWEKVDRAVTDAAPALFLYNPTRAVFVSARVGNLETSSQWGALLSQIWVK